MPKTDQQPNPNRRQTRATNANAHPGRIVIEAQAVRRNKDEIEEEKKARNKKRQAQEARKVNKQAAITEIAEFENQMALDDKDEENKFPRHQKAKDSPSSKKRKGQPKKVSKSRPKKAIQTTAENEDDTDIELTDNDRPQAKKVKTSSGSQALRRTETYLRPEDINEIPIAAHDDTQELTDSGLESPGSCPITFGQSESPLTAIDDDNYNINTPMPRRWNGKRVFEESDVSQDAVEDEEDDFETPRALKRALTVSSGPATENDLAGTESEELDKPKKRPADAHVKKTVEIVDLTKVMAQGKDKRGFRKEVIAKRELIVKDKIRDGSNRDQTISKHTAPGTTSTQLARPRMLDVGQPLNESESFSKRKASSVTIKSQSAPSKPYLNDARRDIDSRASATTGNRIGINHSTCAELEKGASVQTNPMVKTADTFSDEDDSAERATILQSPPKGMQRLSSQAIVKIEKPSRSDERKSRSKKQILDQDILTGWSRTIEPHFIYWFFYKLSPWPSSRVVESCAQRLWNWTFGDSSPLDLSKSPKHIQLLTQKLCDIRAQCAASAFICLDAEFQLASNANLPVGLEEVEELRQAHAQDLLDNMRFLFGKYSVSHDGVIHKSQPYRGKLVLRTVASTFKHVKDIKKDEGAPLPSSHYPKTLLAIAAVVVERALKITSEGKYDFEAHKVIAQPDPSHPARKPSTSMFAFSETIWLPRIEYHLDKSIPKLKEKDWKKIMEEAALFMSSMSLKQGKSLKGKNRGMPEDEEEFELSWESDSESD